MKAEEGITVRRLRKLLMLAGAVFLLLLPAADSQRPDELTASPSRLLEI